MAEMSNGESTSKTTPKVELNGYSNGKEETITEEVDIADLIPQAPDGGWGWVIVFASFMNHFIIDGISYAFGTLLAEYAAYFNSSGATTGALMSTLIGCYLLSAPVASALVNKYGCRIVGMVGAAVATASFLLSTVSESIEVLIITLGVCGGIGFGLMYLPAVVSVSIYFEKKRALAIGIATCGTGIGTFTFGPLGKWLMKENSWQTVHVILACIIVQGAVLYALVFPLAPPRQKKHGQNQSQLHKSSKAEMTNVLLAKQSPYGSIKLHRSTAFIGSANKVPSSTMLTVEQAGDLKRPMYKKDVFYSGSIYNLQEYKDVPNIQDYVASIVSIPAMQEVKPASATACPCRCLPDQMTDVLNEMLDISLFKSPSFNIIIFSILILATAYFIPFAYCSPQAIELGTEATKATYLISVLGISTMFGRLGACLIAQIPRLRAVTVHNICIFGAGLSCIFMPLCTGYVGMAITAFIYGICMGAHVSLSPIVLVDILGLNRLTSSFGLLTLARGISTLAGPVLGGYLFDKTGGYDSGFYMAGGLVILSAVGYSLLEIPFIKRKELKFLSESHCKPQ